MRYKQLFKALVQDLDLNEISIVLTNICDTIYDGVYFFIDDEATAKKLANFINLRVFSGEETAKILEIPCAVELDKENLNVLLSFYNLTLPEKTSAPRDDFGSDPVIPWSSLVTPCRHAHAILNHRHVHATSNQSTKSAILAEPNDPDSVLVVHFCESESDLDCILEHGLLTRNERIRRGLLNAEEACSGGLHDSNDLIFFHVISNEKEFLDRNGPGPWVGIRVSGKSIAYDSELRAAEESRYYYCQTILADLLNMSSAQRKQIGSGTSSFEVVLDRTLDPGKIVETSRGITAIKNKTNFSRNGVCSWTGFGIGVLTHVAYMGYLVWCANSNSKRMKCF